MMHLPKPTLDIVCSIATEAGCKIMEYYMKSVSISFKSDKSPLTEADKSANEIICGRLSTHYPNIPIVSEEGSCGRKTTANKIFWLIDPLDGTKEFISKNGEFTVNIALVSEGQPVLGVIHLPATGELYFAATGKGAHYSKDGQSYGIKASQKGKFEDMVLVGSRSHGSDAFERLLRNSPPRGFRPMGSSIKGCLIAKGEADAYFRFGPLHYWDICAMDIILREAGGVLTDMKGERINYSPTGGIVKGIVASNNVMHEKLIMMGCGVG